MTKDKEQPEKYLKIGFIKTLLFLDDTPEEKIPKIFSWEARRAAAEGDQGRDSIWRLLFLDPMRFFAASFPMAFLISICLWWLKAYPLWGIGVVTFAVPVVGVAAWDLLMFIIFMENTVRSFRRKLSYEKKLNHSQPT